MLAEPAGCGARGIERLDVSSAHLRAKLDRVGRYVYSAARLVPHDSRCGAAARIVGRAVRAVDKRLHIEHVGSTAVDGLPGKGVVDLMLTYPSGLLEVARDVLAELGFQRQEFGRPFPEERPMRVGTVTVLGREYRVHIHVLAEDSTEVHSLRRFRDRLRADERLRHAYAERKRELIEAGITESPHYAEAKGEFILKALDAGGETGAAH